MGNENTDTRPRVRRWWARAAFVAAFGAAAAPIAFAGLFGTAAVLAVGTGGVAATVAASYWFLTSHGVLRAISSVLVVLAPIVVLVLLLRADLLWAVVLSCVLLLAAVLCARAALGEPEKNAMPEYTAPAPRRPFLLMNPRSGGGKVAKFGLQRKAEDLGAEVILLDGPENADVAALARRAVERGADLLGVAGGDGTQALVAAVAAEHDLPFLVISAGTRNHFALDLGLDRDDPATCLDALADGVEVRVDLGWMNGHPFVNNASFGVYAELVQSPAYRDDKTGTVLEMLPELLDSHRGYLLTVEIGDVTVGGPQAVLVSNGPYRTGDLVGMGRRERLDDGVLGVVTMSVNSAREAVGLLQGAHARGVSTARAAEVVVDADQSVIPVGVDGESRMVRTPVVCTIAPAVLRVRLPRHRPGALPKKPGIELARLYRLTGWPTGFSQRNRVPRG
ncbi:diacylglycerol kinase family protein [Rhodococcus sp. TAF43]|uniref:diacylglycerol/lipid kinase family protein n=1 Tax=unclassified Rhodococcus (in: high G+C Gram-positive bacteria) TaxID=192944 RepID=UPI001581E9B7|nr:diacylglycerol kinase family protein [Rhodococcus sp. W8901]QKT11125.1 NAD(+)/NADH kinase [Rhodococcus sp. W8901]